MAVKDLTGQTFGKLTVLKQATKEEIITSGKTGATLLCSHWHCLCSCGNSQIFRGTSLSASNYSQCSICAKQYRIQQTIIKNRISYKGIKNNRLEIIADLNEKDLKGNWLCLAKCECGNEIKRPGVYIKNGNTKSCGCLKLDQIRAVAENRRIDLIGKVFTYLTVLKYLGPTYKENYYYGTYSCQCICGKIVSVKTTYLTTGEVTSCGCKTPERLSLAQGGTGIPYEYKSIQEIIRGLPAMTQWKKRLLQQSNYTCQISNKRGGTLNVHHIIPLNILINKYNITKDTYNEFQDILFNDENGIVLSEEIHQQFHLEYGHDTDYYDLLVFNNSFVGVA